MLPKDKLHSCNKTLNNFLKRFYFWLPVCLIAIFINSTYADTCLTPKNFCDAYNRSDEVFTGRVNRVESLGTYVRYHFIVNEVFKGRFQRKRQVESFVAKTIHPCSNGPVLEVGKSYIVYDNIAQDGIRLVKDDEGIATKLINLAKKEILFLRKNKQTKRLQINRCK